MTLVYLAGAWLLGVLAGAVAEGIWWPGVAAIATAGLAGATLYRRPQAALVGLLASGIFVAGAVRYVDQRPPDEPTGVAIYNDGEPVRFRAVVSDEPSVRGRSQRVRLSVREVLEDGRWAPASGGVLMRAGLFPRHEYGDLLEVRGELETPPTLPGFDYRDYLARQGVVSLIAYPDEVRTVDTGQGDPALAALHSMRGGLGDALADALPEPQAALAQGIFLGQRSSIPSDLTDDMNATGTSHLIAISGHNISLAAALVITGLAWLIGRRQAALAALVAIAAYTALTGASPTVVRAAIMGGLFVAASLAGRPASALPSVALAAALMTGWDPLVIEDVSFQLSFAAIVGLVYLAPALQARGADLLLRLGIDTSQGGISAFMLESTSVTVGAVAATLPLTALNFGRVSAVAPISNLLLVPAFPVILGSSALAAVAGVVWEPLGQAAGWFAWASLTYMIEVARFFADLPLASFDVAGFGAGHAAALYLALAALAWWLARRRPVGTTDVAPERTPTGGLRVQPVWALAGGLAVATALTWWAALEGDGDQLTVSVLDVGQGDAILVETPDGHRILIDGGPSGQAVTEALGREMPFWSRSLDLVALTHPEDDHLTGLIEVLERYDVGEVLASPISTDTAAYEEWRRLIRQADVPYREARAGGMMELGGGATLRVLGPGPDALASSRANDASLVLMVSLGEIDFLLAGDVGAKGEESLLASDAGIEAEVLKVAHHGSGASTTPAFLRAVRPAVAVVSVGEENRFGHPSSEVLERLAGRLVLRTDEHGTVRLSTDGERLWVDVERAP